MMVKKSTVFSFIYLCLTCCQLCRVKLCRNIRSSSWRHGCGGQHDGARKCRWTSNGCCLLSWWHLENTETQRYAIKMEVKQAISHSGAAGFCTNFINIFWLHYMKQLLGCILFVWFLFVTFEGEKNLLSIVLQYFWTFTEDSNIKHDQIQPKGHTKNKAKKTNHVQQQAL